MECVTSNPTVQGHKQSPTFENQTLSIDALLARLLGLLSSATDTATSALVCGELAKNKTDFQHKSIKHPHVWPSTFFVRLQKKRVNIPTLLCSKRIV